MKKKYNELIKNIGLFAIGSFGTKLVSFCMLPLYTAILSTADYGTVDLIQSTAQLLMPILLLSIQDATLRFGMDPEYKKKDVLSTTINIIAKGTFVLLIGIITINITGVIKIPLEYWIFLFFTFLLGSFNNCFNLYLKSKNKALIIAVGGILCTFITCFSNILFLLVFKFGINGYMISNIIGIFIQLIYQFIFGKIYKDLHIKNYKNISKPMIQYSAPLIANSIAWWVNNASDRYILTWISGVATNGIYAVACKIPNILAILQNIFYNAWSISAIAEFDKDDSDGFIGNNYMLYSLISIVGCSVILLLNIPIALILYSKDYFDAWKCVPFLLMGTVFNGIAQLEGALFSATKKTKSISTTTLIGAIANIIGNFIFIPIWGATGAALSTMIGYGVMWTLRTIYLQNFVKMKVNWKKHLITVILLLLQTILATFNILYFIQLVIFILNITLHLNYIKQVINKTFTQLFTGRIKIGG